MYSLKIVNSYILATKLLNSLLDIYKTLFSLLIYIKFYSIK